MSLRPSSFNQWSRDVDLIYLMEVFDNIHDIIPFAYDV